MSVFDPDSFLNETVQGANATTFEPIPEGEYLAVVASGDKAVTVRQTEKGSVILDVTWEIQDAELAEQLGRQTLTVRQSVFLDMTEQNTLDRGKGKNVSLGRLRSALNQNDPNKPWAFGHLKGAGPAMIKVGQRMNPNDESIIYNDVKGVTSA